MTKDVITLRVDPEKRKALEDIAAAMDRDRTYVVNEAIDAYLDLHRWQLEHVRDGQRQAAAGEFASDEEVAEAIARWHR